jgi:hypothetical protein
MKELGKVQETYSHESGYLLEEVVIYFDRDCFMLEHIGFGSNYHLSENVSKAKRTTDLPRGF